MKRQYSKHQYSGPRDIKRSRGAMRLHYGAESRHTGWRDPKTTDNAPSEHPDQETISRSLPPPVSTDEKKMTSDDNSSTSKPRDYSRTPKMRLEAPQMTTRFIDLHLHEDKEKQLEISWPQQCVQDHELETESVENDFLKGLDGYRVVDINHVLKWAMKLQYNHSKICTMSKIIFIKEEKVGLFSTFNFLCLCCDRTFSQTSEPAEHSKVNKACVWGALTSGSYFTQVNHLLSIMDVPMMSDKTFKNIETDIGIVWQDHLWKEIMEAGARERQIAIEKNQISDDGVPFIVGCVDGGWSRRTYGHNFNAHSGAACIIGMETKKCIFLGVRNKFCIACQYYERNNQPQNDHICYKNYVGSSSAMEADIIVEGFTKSVEMHGFRILKFIGDGDSSVYARLRERVPYGKQIKKMECKNHVIKNYTSAIYKIINNTKLPINGRSLLKLRIQKLTLVARKNILHNSKNGNVANLREDFQNGPNHVFGEHLRCKPYYCKWKEAQISKKEIAADTNVLDKMKQNSVVWSMLGVAVETMVKKADRLLHNETNNCAESFMSLIAKYNCGKRIDLTKRGSFQRRVHLAGLHQIKGNQWHHRAWRAATSESPGKHCKKYIKKNDTKKVIRKSHSKPKRLFSKTSVKKGDKDYGPHADDPPPDIPKEDLLKICENKIKEFQLNESEIAQIQIESIGQHGNETYDTYKSQRLTSSKFGTICKRRPDTPCHNHVKMILYPPSFKTADTNYGTINESLAIRLFETQYKKTVTPSGLFIDTEHGFLGASPDGIIKDENAIVEVKCFPSVTRLDIKSLENAAIKIKNFPLKLANGSLEINRKHNYFYQIQGQLKISKANKCYFICFVDVSTPLHVLEILPDSDFTTEMITKLVKFYKTFVMPEIILNRIPSQQKCYEPNQQNT